MFENLSSEKKPSIIAKNILDAIDRGEIKPGDKLPNELEIMEQTGVSRSAVREALTALELMDVIQRRPGNGTYVKEDVSFHKESLKRAEKENTELLVMLEEIEGNRGTFQAFFARAVLEPVIDEIAARRADDDDIRLVSGIVEKMRECCAKNDVSGYHRYDDSFHVALARASGNDVFVAVLKELMEGMRIEYWRSELVWPQEKMERSFKDHLRILEALKKRDAQTVKKETYEHFTTALKWWIDRSRKSE